MKKEHEKCPFTPTLISKKQPKQTVIGDRGVHMYNNAMKGSKLISKHRSDKDPLELEHEKSKPECTFHPVTNHNTEFSIMHKLVTVKEEDSPTN